MDQSIHVSIISRDSQSKNQSFHEPVNARINQSTIQWAHEPVIPSISPRTNHSTTHPWTNHSTNQPTNQSFHQSSLTPLGRWPILSMNPRGCVDSGATLPGDKRSSDPRDRPCEPEEPTLRARGTDPASPRDRSCESSAATETHTRISRVIIQGSHVTEPRDRLAESAWAVVNVRSPACLGHGLVSYYSRRLPAQPDTPTLYGVGGGWTSESLWS